MFSLTLSLNVFKLNLDIFDVTFSQLLSRSIAIINWSITEFKSKLTSYMNQAAEASLEPIDVEFAYIIDSGVISILLIMNASTDKSL